MNVTHPRPAALAVLLAAAATAARADDPIDSVMNVSPSLPAPKLVAAFPKGVPGAWVEALARPDAATKCQAAQTIALARGEGLAGLDAAVGPLARELELPGQHPATRLATAHALIALDARQAADALFRQLADDDPEYRELVEPALARWDYRPARAAWLDRLGKGPPYRRRHVLAIRGLGEAREEKAAPVLRDLVLAGTVPAVVRVEAARALGSVRRSGSEKDAAALAADATPQGATGRLLAASILRHHAGDEAVRLLQALGRDTDPVVAAAALVRLVEIDPKLVLPLLDAVLASPDAGVRSFGVEVLFRLPNEARVRLLGVRLSDLHPDVRGRARRALHDLAGRPEFRGPVIEAGTNSLASSDWRGQEQAALLLGQLDHKPAVKRLLELLPGDRAEPVVAAAWALRRLAVPETLPAVLDFVRGQHKKLLAASPTGGRKIPADAIDQELSQLVQFLGVARYQPADAPLRAMLPRIVPGQPGNPPHTPLGVETRAAAAWAVGMLHEGKPDAELAEALVGRLTDLPTPAGAEHDRVRRMSAVSLGRMKAADSLPTLRRFYPGHPTLDPVANACGWAVEQITGEKVPPPGTVPVHAGGWFLFRVE